MLMPRITVVLFAAVVLFGSMLLGGGAFAAQGTDLADHPLVGTWVVDSDPQDPENPVEFSTFSADGTVIDSAAEWATGHGVWEATGDATATVTFSVLFEDGTHLTIRSTAEVAPDGQSFTGSYTLEFFDPAGEGSGQIGPGTVEGTRMNVEAPGTPVASFEEFFGGPEGTPGATPAT
jgi:hypothetical protein